MNIMSPCKKFKDYWLVEPTLAENGSMLSKLTAVCLPQENKHAVTLHPLSDFDNVQKKESNNQYIMLVSYVNINWHELNVLFIYILSSAYLHCFA